MGTLQFVLQFQAANQFVVASRYPLGIAESMAYMNITNHEASGNVRKTCFLFHFTPRPGKHILPASAPANPLSQRPGIASFRLRAE